MNTSTIFVSCNRYQLSWYDRSSCSNARWHFDSILQLFRSSFSHFSNFIETSRGKIWILEECCQNCESVLKISKQAKFFIIQVIISFASLLETLRPPRQTWTGRRPRPGRVNATWRRRGTCEAPWSLGVLRIQCFLTCKLLRPRAFKKLTVRDLFPD